MFCVEQWWTCKLHINYEKSSQNFPRRLKLPLPCGTFLKCSANVMCWLGWYMADNAFKGVWHMVDNIFCRGVFCGVWCMAGDTFCSRGIWEVLYMAGYIFCTRVFWGGMYIAGNDLYMRAIGSVWHLDSSIYAWACSGEPCIWLEAGMHNEILRVWHAASWH